jgi:hypothetical protein
VRGFWKIIESSRPRCSARSRSLSASRSDPPNSAAGGHLAGGIEDAHDGKGSHRLARTAFSHQRHGLALVDAEADMLQHLDDAGAGAEFDREILDRKCRYRGHPTTSC